MLYTCSRIVITIIFCIDEDAIPIGGRGMVPQPISVCDIDLKGLGINKMRLIMGKCSSDLAVAPIRVTKV